MIKTLLSIDHCRDKRREREMKTGSLYKQVLEVCSKGRREGERKGKDKERMKGEMVKEKRKGEREEGEE